MKVMVLVKANEDSEAGQLPSKELFAEMGVYNEELAKAGIMLAADGLKPSSAGKRVRFDETTTVLDGPFAETKELVAGFWIWEVASLEEAVEWLKRAPFGGGAEVEIRPFFEAADFGEAWTEEMHEKEAQLRRSLDNAAADNAAAGNAAAGTAAGSPEQH